MTEPFNLHKPSTPLYWNPSPEEIRQMCLEIQAGWSPVEERKRRAYSIAKPFDYGTPVKTAAE